MMATVQTYLCRDCIYTTTDLTEFLMHSCCASMTIPEFGADTVEFSFPAEEPSNNLLEKWDDKHVLLLIDCYMKYKDMFCKPQQTKKKVFEKIAEEFNRVSDVVVSGEQCFRKWKKLESKQKEIEDNNSKTGREKKTWKFHKEMEDCLGDNPSVKPLFTFETSGSASSSSSRPSTPSLTERGNSDSESDRENAEEGCSSQNVQQNKRLKRKRKSRSSASELIEFLKDYSEKREKVEEEKVNILKAMHEEKKQFFSQFFTYLKDSKK